MGGEAVADGENVADFAGAGRMVQRAIDTFGRLDTVVNNAGILRDRMLTNMEESEWDAVIAVHLKGAFAPTRHAAAYWREQAKAGTPIDGRIVNTSSPSGVFGNAGQTNYGAAKAGIAAFTIICGLELGRYGVMANAIAPVARTRMTEDLGLGGAPTRGLRRARPGQHLAARRVARLERQRRRDRPRVPRRRRPRLGGRRLAPRPDRPQRRHALGARAAHQGRPRSRRQGRAQLDDDVVTAHASSPHDVWSETHRGLTCGKGTDMPMNLDSVGAVSDPSRIVVDARRTRCSTRSASARARPTPPASSSSSRPRTPPTSRSRCCRRCRS